MNIHKGEITEYTIRKKGHKIPMLAKSLKIKRRSLYNLFGQQNPDPVKICEIGAIIGHNFAQQFPDDFTKEVYKKCGCGKF